MAENENGFSLCEECGVNEACYTISVMMGGQITQRHLCADCMARGVFTPIDEVHHLTPLTEFNVGDPKVSLDPANCIGLCRDCHNRRHEKGYKKQGQPTRVWFDEQGRPVRRGVER